ncbi:MAG: hypothetical protein QXR68_08235, partial [Pyrobaculum sp.]
MRGQVLILTGLLLVAAAVTVFYAYYTASSTAAVAGGAPGYGHVARSWPDYVRAAGSYIQYAASLTSFTLARGALDVGLYGRPSDGRWLHFNYTKAVGELSLESLSIWLASAGAAAEGSLKFHVRGYNGTLGPYPLAAVYSNWNITSPLVTGICGGRYVLRPLDVKAARFVIYSYRDVDVDYVITYLGHTSDIVTLGAGYNEILADMLRFNDPNGRLALIAIDASGVDCTNLDSVKRTIKDKIRSLPWYAEIYQCPLCMLHFKVPPGFLQKGKASEVLLVYSSAGVPTPLVFAIEDRQVGKVDIININPIVTSNPKSVFPHYFGAGDIVTWQRAVVATDEWCRSRPTDRVSNRGVNVTQERPQTSLVSSSARVFATYAANTTRHGFNVFKEVDWNRPVGYRVEALVMPENINYIMPARLDIYYSVDPSTTHPICASFYGVQVVNPVIVWSDWRANSGVWNGRTWDLGGTVYSERQWYLMSVSVGNSTVEWAVYHYNSSGRPLKLLGKTSRPPAAVPPTRFWIVIGNAVVDNPGSETTSWTEAAYYAYVRVRPWVYPEPYVVLTPLRVYRESSEALAPLDGLVVAEPSRRDVVARKSSSIAIDLTSRLDISAALVKNLIIDASMRASAEIIKSSTSVGVLEVRYSYLINVSHTEPRAALGAVFTLYYVTGNTPRNLTLPSILVQYGDYWAVYNVTFTIPKWASFAVLVSIPGSVTARLAVSSGEPRVYYIYIRNREEYYVANYGDGVAVLYAPWGAIKSFDDGRRPHDQAFAGYFGALYNVTNGREKW